MDHVKKYYSHLLFEADVTSDTGGTPPAAGAGKTGLVNAGTGPDVKAKTPGTAEKPAAKSTDTLDSTDQTQGDAKAPSKTEIFMAYFYNNMKTIGPKLDDSINTAIKEAESENGIKGARGFAGIAGAEWIVLRRSIFYTTMVYIILRFINKTGADGARAAVASAANKAKNLKPSKSKAQKAKEKELKKKSTNEDIAYIESLADIGNLIKAVVQRVPTPGVNKQGTYRYFIKDIKTFFSIILGTKEGIRYCKSPVGSGKNHVERYFDFANLNQTYATTLQYIKNMAAGKSPNAKWEQLSPDIIQKTLQGSAFQLSFGEISKVATDMAKQMFLIAYENEDIRINAANEKVQNALSNLTGIKPKGTTSTRDELK
jgi:hypothetical protein